MEHIFSALSASIHGFWMPFSHLLTKMMIYEKNLPGITPFFRAKV
jgi:hypothetical protein